MLLLFPFHIERSQKEYVIFKAGWNQDLNYRFQHELGHTLGLRHEHIWWGLTTETTANAVVIDSKRYCFLYVLQMAFWLYWKW